MSTTHSARLLITCPDKPGIVKAVSGFLYQHEANITALDQHATQAQGGTYFMRVEFEHPDIAMQKVILCEQFAAQVAHSYGMNWELTLVSEIKKVGLLVSKFDHVLVEILWRWSRGMLPCEITHVISNHEDLRAEVERFGVPFTVLKTHANNKQEIEAQIQSVMQHCDVLVLARYMQILTVDFVARWPHRIINIHHSFLPAFVGADPYRQADEKGVKLIGATAHYVTEELDQGPIIEQDVERVDHRYTLEDLRELGKDLERNVLVRALKWHLEDRIIVDGNKTIVFD